MKQTFAAKDAPEIPILQFTQYLVRLGCATVIVSFYLTGAEFGPILHSRDLAMVHDARPLGLPAPVQILCIGILLAIYNCWKLNNHLGKAPIDARLLTYSDLMEWLPPEMVGLILGSGCFLLLFLVAHY